MSKRATFMAERDPDKMPTVDELVAAVHDDDTPEEALAKARGERIVGQPGVPENFRFDPEYAAKNRAEELMSRQVIQDFSPSTRFNFRPGSEDNLAVKHRWMCPVRRQRRGMQGWVPVTDMKEAARLTDHNDLHRGEDGLIYMAGLFLAKIDKTTAENRTALNYQRSRRLESAAKSGAMNPLTKGGVVDGQGKVGMETGETLAQIHDRTQRKLGRKGVHVEADLIDDLP